MKKLFLALLLTLLPLSVLGQIARHGNCGAASTGCTLSSVSTGDLVVCAGIKDYASGSAVTVPGSDTQVTTSTYGLTYSITAGCRVASSSSDTASGTFANAEQVACVAYGGTPVGTTANCNTTGIGANASWFGAASSATLPALTLQSPGTSWVTTFEGAGAATLSVPAGTTAVASSTGSGNGHFALQDTNGAVSTWAQQSLTGCSSGHCGTASIEILGTGAPTAATPTATYGTGTYNDTVSESLSDITSGATVCYTTNGTTPAATTPGTCSTGTPYSGSFGVTPTSGTATVKALATESGYTNSAVATFTYTFVAATPTISLAAGSYYGPQSGVTLSDATSGAAISYCISTSSCTPGTTYSSSLAISSSGYLCAFATATNYTQSATTCNQYTIVSFGSDVQYLSDSFGEYLPFQYNSVYVSTLSSAAAYLVAPLSSAQTNGAWTGGASVQQDSSTTGLYDLVTTSASPAINTLATLPANQFAAWNFYPAASGHQGPCILMSSAYSGYCAGLTTSTVNLWKFASGVQSGGLMAPTSISVSSPATLELRTDGAGHLQVLVNGSVPSGLSSYYTDSTYTSGSVGFISDYGAIGVTSWTAGTVGVGTITPVSSEVPKNSGIYSDANAGMNNNPPLMPWVKTTTKTPVNPQWTAPQYCYGSGSPAQIEYRAPVGSDQFGQVTVNIGGNGSGYSSLWNWFIMLHHQSQEQSGVPGYNGTMPTNCSSSGNCVDFTAYYFGVEPDNPGTCGGAKAELCGPSFHFTKVTPQVSATDNQVIGVASSIYTPASNDVVRAEIHGSRIYGLKQVGGLGAWSVVFEALDSDLTSTTPVGYPGLFCQANSPGAQYLKNWQTGTLTDYADIPEPCTVTNSCGKGVVGGMLF